MTALQSKLHAAGSVTLPLNAPARAHTYGRSTGCTGQAGRSRGPLSHAGRKRDRIVLNVSRRINSACVYGRLAGHSRGTGGRTGRGHNGPFTQIPAAWAPPVLDAAVP